MSKLASVVFLWSALWAVSASAEEAIKLFEEIAVPVNYQGGQIQLRAEFQKPATGRARFLWSSRCMPALATTIRF